MAYRVEKNTLSIPAHFQEIIAASKQEAQKFRPHRVNCPRCGFFILEVYGATHCYARVKCQKCKFNDIIDIALSFQCKKDDEKIEYNKRLLIAQAEQTKEG